MIFAWNMSASKMALKRVCLKVEKYIMHVFQRNCPGIVLRSRSHERIPRRKLYKIRSLFLLFRAIMKDSSRRLCQGEKLSRNVLFYIVA